MMMTNGNLPLTDPQRSALIDFVRDGGGFIGVDTAQTDLEGLEDMEPGGDYPQAWYQDFGEGRSFYTSLGHRDDIWSSDPVFRAHLVGGIRWALGLE